MKERKERREEKVTVCVCKMRRKNGRKNRKKKIE